MTHFAHLHVHTEFSALDGLTRIRELFAAVADAGQKACAVTDHKTLGGLWRAQQAADAAGVKLLPGVEAYLAFGSRFTPGSIEVPADDGDDSDDSTGSGDADAVVRMKTRRYMHLTLIAATPTGWRNLVRIRNASEATKVTVAGKAYPLIDYDLIGQNADGILVLTGCLGGPVIGPLARAHAVSLEATNVALSTVRRDWLLANTPDDPDADVPAVELEAVDAALWADPETAWRIRALTDAELKRAADTAAEADAALTTLVAAVGRDNVFVEVMEHGLPAESAVLPEVSALAERHGLPLVATNDAHYLRAEDAPAHDAWLAVRTKKQVADKDRYRFHGTGYHLRTEAEMRALRAEDWWQQAVTNTGMVADRVADRVLPKPEPMLPTFPTPDGFTSNRDYLIAQVMQGAKERYGDPLPQQVRDRLNEEFPIITNPVLESPELDFTTYMLMVAEMIGWERQQGGLVGAGRGSAAGCAIAYCLGITNIDPLANGLLMERFLERGRADWPDIDTDFQKSRREGVLDHLTEFWGEGRVSLIGAVPVSKSKRALRDAARVLGAGRIGDLLSKAVPDGEAGKPMGLSLVTDEANPATGEFRRALAKSGEDGGRVLALARLFEDTAAGEAVHACGVVVADRDLTDLIPMRIHKDTGRWITEWDSKDVESFGLIKLDVLALRNLDIAAASIDLISTHYGEQVTMDGIPESAQVDGDERVAASWRLLQEGRTAGIFQLESPSMRKLAQDIRPTGGEDLSALLALFRPGPLAANMHTAYARRKNGLEPVDYSWATTDPTEQQWLHTVLGETYGLIVYQESMMRLGTLLAGFNTQETSKLRKAVGKKKKDLMAEVGEQMIARAAVEYRDDAGNVISPVFQTSTVEHIYEAIKGAAEYAFNKSHSVAYARLSWQTAYLKANWPAAYGAAILSVTDEKGKRVEALHSLTSEGIAVLPPDVNRSQVATIPEGSTTVRLGLSEVRGTGEAVASRIVATRTDSGDFTDLHDFMNRVRKADSAQFAASTSDVVGLVEAGAFDAFGPRFGLSMVARASRSVAVPVPQMEWGVIERTTRQRSRLLTVVGENVLARFQQELRAWNVPGPVGPNGEVLYAPGTPVGSLPDRDGSSVTTLGVLAAFSTATYRGGTRADMVIEGTNASIRAVMWDEALSRARATEVIPPVGSLVGATGRIQVRELETTSEDGSVERVMSREMVVMTLHAVPVCDPVVGALDGDVPIPDLTRDATAEDTDALAPAPQPELVPAREQVSEVPEMVWQRDTTPLFGPMDVSLSTAQTPTLQAVEAVGASSGSDSVSPVLVDGPAVPVLRVYGGWASAGADAALAATLNRLLGGGGVPGVRLRRIDGRPEALLDDAGAVIALVTEVL